MECKSEIEAEDLKDSEKVALEVKRVFVRIEVETEILSSASTALEESELEAAFVRSETD